MQQMTKDQSDLLSEIFLTPSKELIENRFSAMMPPPGVAVIVMEFAVLCIMQTNIVPLDSALSELDKTRQFIADLDLRYIVNAMCATTYPLPRWTESDALHCCSLYKNFLFLFKKYHCRTIGSIA